MRVRWYRFYTEQWIYPLQSIVCFAVLLFFWKNYEFRPVKGWGFGIAVGAIGIVLWILLAMLYAPLGVKDWPSIELSVPLILDNTPVWSTARTWPNARRGSMPPGSATITRFGMPARSS